MKKIYLILPILLVTSKLFSQTSITPVQICPQELTWGPTKPPLAPGAEITVIEGNPKDTGHFTIRVKMPPHYLLAPHTHPAVERTTVISGSINIGLGEVLDSAHSKKMIPGCFYLNPANTPHFAFTNETETIVQISTDGPWGFKFLEKKTK